MSHLRNLFHKPAGNHIPVRTPAIVASAVTMGGSDPAASEFLDAHTRAECVAPAEAVALADYPVEEAKILPEHRVVCYTTPHSPAADRFRYLRMRLREHGDAGKLKTLLITSPLSSDGKSTVILNLATALAERGRRSVLLIDADLHRSHLVEKLGLNTWTGLTECLHDGCDPHTAIRRIDPLGWHLLPSGEPRKNPTELLQTPALANVIRSAAAHFDWVLIDSPPAVLLTDAVSLQQHVDATLLVVRAGQTPREAIEQATALLGTRKMFGVVLNGLDARNHPYSKYRYYD
jgi:capsular exopolysaccharide synthesis family protein